LIEVQCLTMEGGGNFGPVCVWAPRSSSYAACRRVASCTCQFQPLPP